VRGSHPEVNRALNASAAAAELSFALRSPEPATSRRRQLRDFFSAEAAENLAALLAAI